MCRVLLFVVIAAALAGCPDLSDLSTNFDASFDAGDAAVEAAQDAAAQDSAPDVVETDCGTARRIQAVHFNNDDPDADAPNVALTLPLAQSAGDFILATINYDDTSCGEPTVADSSGNTYVKLVAADGLPGAATLETWGAENVVAADLGQNVVTATFPNVCNGRAMKVVHYTGIATTAAVESTSSEHGDSDSGAPTQTLTVTSPALLFAHTADEHVAYEAGAGWALVMFDDWATIAEEEDALDAGAYLVDYTHSPENWVIQGVALRRCQ